MKSYYLYITAYDYREGRFEQLLKRTSLLVAGSRVLFSCYNIAAYSLER